MVNEKIEKQLKRKWYLLKIYLSLENVLKIQCKWKNWKQVLINSVPPFPAVYFPFQIGLSPVPISKVIKVGDREKTECKTFYKKRCEHCKKQEIVCIVVGDYIDSFMRYKQLKKCIRKRNGKNR